MLVLDRTFHDEIVAHALEGYPLEVCGLLSGTPAGVVHAIHRADNLARSTRVYTLDPKAMLRADREAEAAGDQVLGVYHSHTHTDAKPSPADIAEAPDPDWHYVLVSLRDDHPSVRSWNIRNGTVVEEDVVVQC